MAHRLHHAAHFAVAAFGNGHAVPAIGPFAAAIFDRAKLRRAVVQVDAIEQFLLFFLAQSPQHPHRVLALQTKTGVHQLIGQLARTGEQQQALGVQVQAPHRLPFAVLQLGQFAEHGRTVLRVIMADDLARGLVVGDHARRWRIDAHMDGFAVDLYLVAILHPLAHMGRLVVDGNAAFGDEFFHLQPRAHARLGQHFVQLGRVGLGREHALAQIWHGRIGNLFVVKLARHHIGQNNGFVQGWRFVVDAAPRGAGSVHTGLFDRLVLRHIVHLGVSSPFRVGAESRSAGGLVERGSSEASENKASTSKLVSACASLSAASSDKLA